MKNSKDKRRLLVQKLLQKQKASKAVIVARKEETDSVPLSPQQMRLWLLHQFDPKNTAYNLVSCFRLSGIVNERALTMALNAIEARHGMLRTVFRVDNNGNPYQKILPTQGAPYYVHDLRIEQGDTIRELVEQKVIEEANVHFDFENGPLWRISFLKIDEKESILMVNVHHIAFDGWSLGVFINELFRYYQEAIVTGFVNPSPLKIQYADYSVYIHERLTEDLIGKQANFWCDYLKNCPPLLEFPYDKARQDTPSSQGATTTLVMPRPQFEALCEIGRPFGITPFNVFMGVLKVLLYRYTGQDRIVVGSPVSGRELEDVRPLIGIFANTLPIVTHIDPQENFIQLLQKISANSLAAFKHPDLSFDAIVEAVKPERVLGANPIFQVFYAYQTQINPGTVAGLEVLYQIRDFGTTKFDLSLDVMEGPEGPTCIFEYDTQLFSHDKIERLIEHFNNLANAFIANPEQAVGQINFLSKQEVLVVAPAPQSRELPVEFQGTMAERFSTMVEQYGQRCAVVSGDRELTYGELDMAANAVAVAMKNRGIHPGTVIGISMPRDIELIVSILACHKLGCAFIALDLNFPRERLAFVIADAGINTVITDANLREQQHQNLSSGIARHQTTTVTYSELFTKGKRLLKDNTEQTTRLPKVNADTNAYVIYTSGTTGNPKGVAVSHRNWLNALYGWVDAYKLGDDIQNHLQMAHYTFDVFCGDFIRALGTGGKLVICQKEIFAVPADLLALIQEQDIQCAEFVPAVFRPFATYLEQEQLRLEQMKVLIVASDSWYLNEYRQFSKLLSAGSRLINSYGMVECTIDSTWFEITSDTQLEDHSEDEHQIVPIGKVFANVDIYVLDNQMQVLPIGIPGEIYVGGLGVVDGYINRPERTTKKFVTNPFVANETLYGTGDIGFKRHDGALVLVGRQDHQVKVRGQRIELAEVEAALLHNEQIKQAVVVLNATECRQPQLVGYVVPEQGQHLNMDTIKSILQDWLPLYMIPDFFIELDELPLNNSGKVDRKKLPEPANNPGSMERAFVSPRNLNEEILSGIWAQALNLPRVDIYDDFFALGGHSLTAVQVASQIRKACSVNLSVQDIFTCPTIESQAKKVASLAGNSRDNTFEAEELPLIVPNQKDRHKPFPMTPIQQAYWIGRSDLFEFGNISAHSYDEFELRDLDPIRLEVAWNKVIRQHDMLRTVVNDNGTLQVLETVSHYHVQVIDLSARSEAECQQGLNKIRAEMSHQVIDVRQWPTFDMRISRLSQNKLRMHFSTDAIMFDVRSFLITLTDLMQFYLDEAREVKPLALSFRDYVLAENKLLKSPAYQKARAYWQKRIPDLPPAPQLPLGKNPAQVTRPRFTRLHNTLDAPHWKKLKEKSTRTGITPTGLMLAAYAEILTEFSQEPAFSLNLTFLNRRPFHPDVNEVVGEFTSLTMLSVDNSRSSSSENTFISRARKIQADLWRDLEHNDMNGVEVLREIARLSGDASRAKMPVVFTSALVMSVPEETQDFYMVPVHRDGITQTSQVWLDCGVWEERGELLCNWDVVKEMYPEGFIETMFEEFWSLVRRLSDDDQLWSSEVTRDPAVRQREDYPVVIEPDYIQTPGVTLVSMFLDSVKRSPENIAVVSGERQITYRQLSEHSSWLANTLLTEHKHGPVVPGELIAVIMHKGWEQVAATLGVMMAGAAYLPIDRELPESRILELLKQAKVKRVVTQPWLTNELPEMGEISIYTMTPECHVPLSDLDASHFPAWSDIAYVIFTSGSTGLPKGVVIDHRGAANTIFDVNRRFQIDANDSVLAVSALNFDLSVYDIFGLLAAGGKIVFPEHDSRLDPRYWLQLIEKHQVSIWNTVPALMGLLVNYVERKSRNLNPLRNVLMSGDWIPLHLPDRIRNLAPAAEVTSLGGATEASIWSILYPIKHVDPSWQSVPYGKAMHNQGMYVLNHQLEPCPTWVVGDIYIGGIGLALGYWGDKEKTDAVFIKHPVTGARLYRTGDLGRMMPDGNIEFMGRSDFQVKVQGHRIELGEIEHNLSQHPSIKDVVVSTTGERHGDKSLVAYVIPQLGKPGSDTSTFTPVDVRSFLSSKLPAYMVPRKYVQMKEFPLTANGKLDRSRLPNPVHTPINGVTTYKAPETKLEKELGEVWQQLLSVEKIGIRDDFLALGGDSMKAVEMLSLIHTELQVEVTLRQILSSNNIEQLAKTINESKVVAEV